MKPLRTIFAICLLILCARTAMTDTATMTILHNFNYDDGSYPVQPPIEGSDSNFYGTTYEGGADGNGIVYMMTPQGTLTTLYTFQGYDGIGPRGLLIETNGLFYGSTKQGGINITITNLCCGTLFTITSQGTLTTIYNFDSTDGNTVDSGLVPSGNGFYYGTTYGGGTVTTPYDGTNSDSYGDSVNNPPGTVYKITSQGTLTTIHSFSGSDGANPGKEAVVGLNGNLYGTTLFGGSADYGTIYTISSAGTFSSLYSFTNGLDGAFPKSQLVQGTDGNLYGTTLDGGGKVGMKWCSTAGCGAFFKITPQGTLTSLHDFSGDPEPAHPGSLIFGPDGNLYGTSYAGGTNHEGTVFSITTDGAVTTLYQFNVLDGMEPLGGLILASDGNYYGTTSAGGANGYGTIFKITVNTNANSGCIYTLSPASVTLASKGGSKSITVKPNSTQCTWTAASSNSFISITSGSSGTGDGKVEFTVPGNTNTTALTGTINIGSELFEVNQAAGGCTFSLSPKSAKAKATGGTATVKVKPNLTDCDWSATSNDGFITITNGLTGSGLGAVTYTVEPNTTANIITGSLTIAGETFTIIQAGVRP